MKITKYFTRFTKQIAICLREHGLGQITISRILDYTDDDVWLPSYISWSGCGSQTIDNAGIFISAMKKAVYLAAKMDKDEEITEGELKV